MAIHNDCPGLTVGVVVDDKALPEYEGTGVEGGLHGTIRYVEAQADSKFAIRWFFDKTFTSKHAIAFSVYVDGDFVDSKIFTRQELRSQIKEEPGGVKYLKRREGNTWFGQELRFSFLDTSKCHNRNLNNGYQRGQNLQDWENHFQVEPGRIGRKVDEWDSGSEAAHNKTVMVPEKLLKGSAKSLRASFGDSQSIPETERHRWTTSSKAPTYSFTFKCRTRANLQALHILPPSPGPAPVIRPGSIQKLLQANKTKADNRLQIRLNDRLRRLSTSAVIPEPPEANVTGGLRVEEIIAMIAIYRGGSDGLAGQSKNSLLGLLKFYEASVFGATLADDADNLQDKDKKAILVKPESVPGGNGSACIKRECEYGASASGVRKRSKPETIVLDD